MIRYVAFLRAINVGGHTVKMDELRRLFEEMGFEDVSTFIASGNVAFLSDEKDAAELEARIEAALEQELGYEVKTFVRTDAELASVAAHEPLPDVARREGDSLHVAFLKAPPDAATRARVMALSGDTDVLELHGRELYWLRRGSFAESALAGPALERALKGPTTVRNANTPRRLAAKFPPA